MPLQKVSLREAVRTEGALKEALSRMASQVPCQDSVESEPSGTKRTLKEAGLPCATSCNGSGLADE